MGRIAAALMIGFLGMVETAYAKAPPGAVTWSAEMPEERLDVGEKYRIEVWVSLNHRQGIAYGGPDPDAAFVVQVDAPECVRLVVEDPQRPWDSLYERAVTGGVAYVDFKLKSKPKVGDMLALNLCGYIERKTEKRVTDAEGTRVEKSADEWFVRERGNLLLERGAELRPADADRSRWGDREDRLDIGDTVAPFTLPDVTGANHDLRDYLGRYYLILAFYRNNDEQFCVAPLVNLHFAYEDFDRLGAKVICVSKEDESLESFEKLVSRFRPVPPRTLFLWDEGGRATRDYDPITYYLVDLEGRIREIFPGTRFTRCPPRALLHAIADVLKADGVAPPEVLMKTGEEAATDAPQSQPTTSGS
jgi:hypothetical protein